MTTKHRDCLCGVHLVTETPPMDWVLSEIYDKGPGHYHRYRVEGVNLNYPPCHPSRRFIWSVPSVDDPRYDKSAATLTQAGQVVAHRGEEPIYRDGPHCRDGSIDGPTTPEAADYEA